MKTTMTAAAANLRAETMAARKEMERLERETDLLKPDAWMDYLAARERYLTLANKRA